MRSTQGTIDVVRRCSAALLLAGALTVPALTGAATAAAATTAIPKLADRITGPDLHAGVTAVQEALARGGVATRDGRRTIRRAVRPAASSAVTRYETINLAVDARDQIRGGRVTLADLDRTLLRFKAFRKRGRAPGVALRDFMATWVREAARRPARAQSFAPLLLAELARRQRPSIDLAAGTFDPQTLRLSLLETDLIAAAFDRFAAKDRRPLPRRRAPRRGRAAADAGPGNCTEYLKEYLGKTVPGWDQVTSSAIGNVAGEALAIAIANLVTGKNVKDPKAVFEANKNAYGGILSIVNTLMRLQKLAALYAGVQIYVDVPVPSIEKPEAQQNYIAGQDQYGDGIFTANVGLSPEAQQAYDREIKGLGEAFRKIRKAVQDCAGTVGLPAPSFSDDVAEDLNAFKVKWTLKASSKTANYEFKKTKWFAPGGRIGELTRVDPTLAAHVFHVDIPTQPPWKYAPDRFTAAPPDEADATVELITAQPPTLGTLINGALGSEAPFGLVDALVELSLGWFQAIDTPTHTGTLEVTEHRPKCIVGGASRVRSAQATAQCTGKYAGTFSGTADLLTGPAPVAANVTFNGSLVVAPVPSLIPDLPSIPGLPPQPTAYKVESGTLHLKITGTTLDGCHLAAEGDTDLAADPSTAAQSPLQITQGPPQTYTLRLQPPLVAVIPGTLSECPDPGSNKAITWPLATGVGALIYTPDGQTPGPGGQVAGAYTGRADPAAPAQTWQWTFSPS